MSTTAQNLRQAVEGYPGGPRAFQRQVRHTGRIAGSYHALTGYLYRGRAIPDSYLEAAAMVLGVTLESLAGEAAKDDTGAAGVGPKMANPDTESDPFADIRAVVIKAGADPSEDALVALDPKYPRKGLSERNWGILYATVGEGKTPAEVAQETKLSGARIAAIRDEYAELVRRAARMG